MIYDLLVAENMAVLTLTSWVSSLLSAHFSPHFFFLLHFWSPRVSASYDFSQ